MDIAYISHVETMTVLCQQKSDDMIDITLDLDEPNNTSAEVKATWQEIREYNMV